MVGRLAAHAVTGRACALEHGHPRNNPLTRVLALMEGHVGHHAFVITGLGGV